MTQRNGGTRTTKTRKRVETRQRKKFAFTLDYNKRDEWGMGQWLDGLKDGRYLPTIRAALRLFCDLRAGRLDVFYELFPQMVQEIQARKASDEFNTIIEQLAIMRAEGGRSGAVFNLASGDDGELPEIVVVGNAKRASAAEIGANVGAEMGNLFSFDD